MSRLDYLREQIRNENISYGEIAELHDLAGTIDPGDTELREWAGIPEQAEYGFGEYLEGVLSYCCDARITETGFCEQCGEHAL